MPIPFSLIHDHLKISIVQKLDLWDFLEFRESYRDSYEIAKKVKSRFQLSIENTRRAGQRFSYFNRQDEEEEDCECCLYDSDGNRFCFVDEEVINSPVQFAIEMVAIEGDISDGFCEKLTEFRLITNSSINELFLIHFDFECTSEQFNALLEASDVFRLAFRCLNPIPLEYLRVPAMQNIEEFSVACFDFTDDHLQCLRAPSISLDCSGITSIGFNSFLKEWLRGEREIFKVQLTLKENDFANEIDDVFHEIPYIVDHSEDSSSLVFIFTVEKEEEQTKINIKIHYVYDITGTSKSTIAVISVE